MVALEGMSGTFDALAGEGGTDDVVPGQWAVRGLR